MPGFHGNFDIIQQPNPIERQTIASSGMASTVRRGRGGIP
jgi:hypothetical protein